MFGREKSASWFYSAATIIEDGWERKYYLYEKNLENYFFNLKIDGMLDSGYQSSPYYPDREDEKISYKSANTGLYQEDLCLKLVYEKGKSISCDFVLRWFWKDRNHQHVTNRVVCQQGNGEIIEELWSIKMKVFYGYYNKRMKCWLIDDFGKWERIPCNLS